MIFNEEHKVIIDSLSEEEAVAFIKFLESEKLRHLMDIKDCDILIYRVIEEKFNESSHSKRD